jgi:hypothetical protein
MSDMVADLAISHMGGRDLQTPIGCRCGQLSWSATPRPRAREPLGVN